MKKALCNLQFIVADLDREILKYGKPLMPSKVLVKLRLLKHLRKDIFDIIEVYRSELKKF